MSAEATETWEIEIATLDAIALWLIVLLYSSTKLETSFRLELLALVLDRRVGRIRFVMATFKEVWCYPQIVSTVGGVEPPFFVRELLLIRRHGSK